MREILFRGKRDGFGEWVQGNLTQYMDLCGETHCYITPQDDGIATWEVDPETVGQFTGLCDKNGKRVFEGDICRFREWNNGYMCWVGAVHYEYQQFVISGGKNRECETPFYLAMSRFLPENIEVIGTAHDNPELLKGE